MMDPPAEDFFELAGTTLHQRYDVERVVGEGGFGVVYRGRHRALGQPVAIKCLKIPRHFTPEARASLLSRFEAEGKHLARLAQHPSILAAHDFAVTQGAMGEPIPYLVLEWLEGDDLRTVLSDDRRAPMNEKTASQMLRDAIDAMAYAHEEGIAHRDIKPENLFLAQSPRGAAIKVLDFGIAKLMLDGERITRAATKTSSGFNAFTPGYGAPEQFRSEVHGETGPWTDVHALGLVLVEMVTGRPALDGAHGVELYQSCLGPERPTPRRRGAEVSDAFEALCERALALSPKDRFADAGEMLRALDAASSAGELATAETALPALGLSAAERMFIDGHAEVAEAPRAVDPMAATALPEAPAPEPAVPAVTAGAPRTIPDAPAPAPPKKPAPAPPKKPAPPPKKPAPPPKKPAPPPKNPAPPRPADLPAHRSVPPATPRPAPPAQARPASSMRWGPVAFAMVASMALGGVLVNWYAGKKETPTPPVIPAAASTARAAPPAPKPTPWAGSKSAKKKKKRKKRKTASASGTLANSPFAPDCGDVSRCESLCRGGDVKACDGLTEHTNWAGFDHIEGLRLARLACDKGSARGCGSAGTALTFGRKKDGKEVIPPNPAAGVPLMKDGCQRGDEYACLYTGHHYSWSRPRNATLAARYYRRACLDLRFGSGCHYAAKLFEEAGQPHANATKARAYRCHECKEDRRACNNTGFTPSSVCPTPK